MDKEPQTLSVYLDEIQPNPWNPHGMTHQEFEDLKESLKEDGQWRQILVVKMDEPDDFTPTLNPDQPYRIIDGEHLHRAMVSNSLAGEGPDKALVLVYGNNSEVPVERQMEIGQTINHGMRGSLEDARKTGMIVERMLSIRSEEELSRRTGQSINFLQTARRMYSEPARRAGNEDMPNASAVRVNKERKGQTVPLVFEDNETLEEYNSHIKFWEKEADPDGKMSPGRRRIQAVLAALRNTP